MAKHERVLIQGSGGMLELFLEPHENAAGLAVIAHPHPLHGGTADNKVVTTMARAFRDLGCHTVRPNFRGAGGSEGGHDFGNAETEDLLAVHDYATGRFGNDCPLYLAGFSFGAYVITRLAKRLADDGRQAKRLVLVGTAAGYVDGTRYYPTESISSETLVIHGAADTIVPLANVMQWAEPLELVINVIPGADHFFHHKLTIIRRLIVESLRCCSQ